MNTARNSVKLKKDKGTEKKEEWKEDGLKKGEERNKRKEEIKK